MLIRLLQSFETVELAQDEQPHFSKTPDVWTQGMGNEYLGDFTKLDPEAKRDRVAIGMAEGWRWRKAREKVWPKSHLTMYALVRVLYDFFLPPSLVWLIRLFNPIG